MKRYILLSLVIVFFFVLLLAGSGYAMAAGIVFQPGSPFFPVQKFVEHRWAMLISDPVYQAHYLIDVAERRLESLRALASSANESSGLDAFDTAIREAVTAVGTAPEAELPVLRTRLAELVADAQAVLDTLRVVPNEDPERLAGVKNSLESLAGMVGSSPPETVFTTQPNPTPISESQGNEGVAENPGDLLTPQAVQFPEGSAGAEHAFFALTGKHLELSCVQCHENGVYTGLPNLCIDCHLDKRPQLHYEMECANCHTPEDWNQVIFDHVAMDVSDCQSCHLVIRPVNHYSGICSACHTTTAWRPANFNHQAAQAVDCQGCHEQARPARHFAGQCSACHKTSGWLPASFNHSVARATDCQGCHNRPANHFSGQCSACHKTTGWLPASFNHGVAKATNCQDCHQAPAGHYEAQCSACHTPGGWNNISMRNHSFPVDHGDAKGECAACHGDDFSRASCTRCHNKAELTKRHEEEGIVDLGDCLSCHPKGDKGDD